MELKGLKKLIIHFDIANLTPELSSEEELNNYFSALDALCRVILARRPVLLEKYAYFEGSFRNPEPLLQHDLAPGKLPPLLLRFKGVFNNLPHSEKYQQSLPYVILDMFRLRGYETRVSQKEAEQMIPDEIMKKQDSLHAIVTDDKARDTTRCKIRVVHTRQRAYAVRNLGIADKVYSLEELAERNYLICWLYKKIKFLDPKDCISLKNIPQVTGDTSFNEVDLSGDFENFTTNDLRRLVLNLVSSDEERISRFLNVGDDYNRLGKFLETVLNRLCSEQTLLMHLWGKLRLHREIEKIMTVNELDTYFMRCFDSEQIDLIKLEHELKDTEINLGQVLRIKGTADEIKSRISEIQRRIDEIYSLEAKLNEKKEELEREEKREEELKESLTQVERELKKRQNENQKKVERIEQLRSEVKSIEEEIKRAESQIEELESRKTQGSETLRVLKEKVKNLSGEVKDLERQITEKEKIHDELSSKREKLIKDIGRYEKEIKQIEEFLNSGDNTIQTLKEKIQSLNQEKSNKEREIEDKANEVKVKESELEKLKSEYENLLSREAQIREEYRKIQKLEELKALYEKVEAFRRSVGEYERVMNIDERFESVRKELERLKSRLTEILRESL